MIKKIISFIWQLPQNLIGWYISRNKKIAHKVNGKSIYLLDSGEGMSIGNYIFIQKGYSEKDQLKHEYGHCIQSLVLGPLYLFVIFIPSYCWWIWFYYYSNNSSDIRNYYKFFTEKWADWNMNIKRS